MKTQADRVIEKFEGAPRLAELIGRDDSTVYRWTYPREKGGTGGVIPGNALVLVIRAAKQEGILLTDADLSPLPSHEE